VPLISEEGIPHALHWNKEQIAPAFLRLTSEYIDDVNVLLIYRILSVLSFKILIFQT
jgi:hypothetical protein